MPGTCSILDARMDTPVFNVPKTLLGAHLGFWRPLESLRGQTKQKVAGMEVVYGILEQGRSVQRAQNEASR